MLLTLSCRMDIAAKYGLDVAVFLHTIYHWMLKNQAEDKHFHDGRYWAYASYSGLVNWFYPLWSIQTVKRIVAKCKDKGLLLVGDFNEDKYIHTNWYSPSDEILEIYGGSSTAPEGVRNRTIDGSNLMQKWSEIEPSNKVNINNKNNKPPIVPQGGRRARSPEWKEAPDWKPERFARFWSFYPREGRKDKQKAIRAWDKLKPDDDTLKLMADALIKLKESDEWQRGIGIPYVSTWLNGHRWLDAESLNEPPDEQDEPEEVACGWQ